MNLCWVKLIYVLHFFLTLIFILDEDLDNKNEISNDLKLKVESKDDEEEKDDTVSDVINTFTLAKSYKYDKKHSQWCQLTFAVSETI